MLLLIGRILKYCDSQLLFAGQVAVEMAGESAAQSPADWRAKDFQCNLFGTSAVPRLIRKRRQNIDLPLEL
jgi:hypothetical protein